VRRLLGGLIACNPDRTLEISSLDPHRSATTAKEWMVATKKWG